MRKSFALGAGEVILCAFIGLFGAALLLALAALIGSPDTKESWRSAWTLLRETAPMGFGLGFSVGCLLLLKRKTS
jgi:hypothetical protein